MGRKAAGVVIGLALLLSSCGVQEGGRAPKRSADPPLADRSTVALAAEESVALIESETARGSAVLVADGYLVTNAHLVDPFGQVQVRFASGGRGTVPVVGVDLTADVALLGPIDTTRSPLPKGDPSSLAEGDGVFLAGYPEPSEDDEDEGDELEVDRGAFRETKHLADWGLDYLVTSASFRDGEDGGALLDDRGRLVGLLALADGGAAALSLTDVERVARDLRVGKPTGAAMVWEPVPAEQGDGHHVISTSGRGDVHAFFVSGSALAPEIEIAVSDPKALVGVYAISPVGESANQAAIDAGDEGRGIWGLFATGGEGVDELDSIQVLEPDADGTMVAITNSGQDRIVVVETPQAVPDLEVDFSPGAVEFELDLEVTPLPVGEEATGTVTWLDGFDIYSVPLEAGTRVRIDATTATAGIAFGVIEPGEPWALAEVYGPEPTDGYAAFDADGELELEVPVTGTYQVLVFCGFNRSTTYRLSVTEQP